MDPLTALSLAGNIVQFIDFAGKILHATVSGRALPAHEELETTTLALRELAAKLRIPRRFEDVYENPDLPANAADKTLNDLCHGCVDVADELLVRLTRLKVEGKHQMWKSFQNAIKSAWSQKELDALSGRLSEFRKALDTHILSNLNDTINAIALQQSKRFDEIDRKTQQILQALLEPTHTRSEDVYDQLLAAAQLLSRSQLLVSAQDDETRVLNIEMEVLKGDFVSNARAENVQGAEDQIQTLAEEDVLESMSFKGMAHREEEIAVAHKNTFLWMLHPDSTSSPQKHTGPNFMEWLKSGRGTYWINGKAGSGKSTLMRFICRSHLTRAALREWADSLPLTIGSFFFWNSGTRQQRSQTGLLRTLLHEILSQNRELIPIVMPSVWARAYSNAVKDTGRSRPKELSFNLLLDALKALIMQRVKHFKLCLFIDGLDEYEGDTTDLADLFSGLVESDDVKVCLSSRPLVPLEYAFKTSPGIRLQDLTYDDIKLYVNDTLHGNKVFQQLAANELEKAPALVDGIVARADGVFLWVMLIVRSLLIGVHNRDGMDDLERRLAELPTDLEALFENMLTKRIDRFYQARGASLFQIVRAAGEQKDEPMTVLSLSFADESDPQWALKAPVKPLTESETSDRCNSMEDRLNNCCAGLLEVKRSYYKGTGLSRLGRTPPESRIHYLHRTVRDYLHQYRVWKTITAKTEGSGFDADISLLRSCILQLKATKVGDTNEIDASKLIWALVTSALELARNAELKKDKVYIPLLDEVDRVVSSLLRQSKGFYRRHWSFYYQRDRGETYDWNITMIDVTSQYGLTMFANHKKNRDLVRNSEKKKRQWLRSLRGMFALLCQLPRTHDPDQRYPVNPHRESREYHGITYPIVPSFARSSTFFSYFPSLGFDRESVEGQERLSRRRVSVDLVESRTASGMRIVTGES